MSLLRSLRTSSMFASRTLRTSSMRYGIRNDGTEATKYMLKGDQIEDAGDYFKYKYVFDDHPETLARFAKAPQDPMGERALYEWDNYIFEYHGQWWDTGYPMYHLAFIGILFFFIVNLTINDQNSAEQRRCGIRYYDPTPGLKQASQWNLNTI